jgi:glycosyltransferase involved in cell wall biosynthesis
MTGDDSNIARPLRIHALMSKPCAGVGVGATCRALLQGAQLAGHHPELFTSRDDAHIAEPFPVHSYAPGLLRALPHRLTRRVTVPRAHLDFARYLSLADVAYLWPSVPTGVFRAVRDFGRPVVGEAINTRMADAKPILDAAFEALGVRPSHRITEERIRVEEENLTLMDYIFSPSPATDASLARCPAHPRILPSSYGVWVPPRLPERRVKAPGEPVTFLFVGLSCIRKGLHHLLEAWKDVPGNAHLRIAGMNQPELWNLFADVFAQENVSATGFTPYIAAEYAKADVFVLPSLEEGDPLVIYEAAARGLPVIASQVGSGRIGAESGAIHTLDTANVAALRHTVETFTKHEDLRRDWGDRARAASFHYDWSKVAARRFALLAKALVEENRV